MSTHAWELLSNRAVATAAVFYFLALLSHLVEWSALIGHRRTTVEERALVNAGDVSDIPAEPPAGITPEEEERCLGFLLETGQVTRALDRYVVEALAVDTRRHPEIGRRLKAHWTRVAAERIEQDAPGQFSYNVFTVSQADFERIRELHLAYFHALRAIVAESQPGERVAVANVQLFTLDEG